uniref:Uncharacterized protein n=1 Tax=Vespula pensylvanica TaxID=30213 RepID=A0A834KHA7_VESPE|nr:hypothetical protein H0235_014402 [Vespula pensylvanica]
MKAEKRKREKARRKVPRPQAVPPTPFEQPSKNTITKVDAIFADASALSHRRRDVIAQKIFSKFSASELESRVTLTYALSEDTGCIASVVPPAESQ